MCKGQVGLQKFPHSGSVNKSDLHICLWYPVHQSLWPMMMQTTEDTPAAASGSSFGTLVQTLLFGVSVALPLPREACCDAVGQAAASGCSRVCL